jgi:predicted enzyme related to lactoylglutathione lyase
MGNRVVHFEIHADQPDRAIQFYSTLFGWRFQKWEGAKGYWLITTGESFQPGINGGLVQRPASASPSKDAAVHAYVCTVGVENLDAIIAKAVGLGAQIVQPKTPIHDAGWLSYLRDTEGNVFGMLEIDSAAI